MKTKKLIAASSFLLMGVLANAQWNGTYSLSGTGSLFTQGNVGIQSSTVLSGVSLEVGNNLAIKGTHLVYNSGSGVIDWGSGGTGDLWFRRLNTQGVFSSGFNNLMVIRGNGNVGIGASAINPVTLLHVGGDLTFGSATNKRKWRFITQNWLDYGKMFLLPDDGSGNADYSKALTIDPRSDYSSFTFGDETSILRTSIGRAATGAPYWGTTYLGFNAIYNATNANFEHEDNSAANGGAVIWANVDGQLMFSSIKSNGSTGNASSETDVINNRSMVIKQSSTFVPQVLIGKDDIGSGNPHQNDYALAVDGKIVAKEIYVTTANWPDYVFDKKYQLMPLSDVQNYISQNSHLPEIPSAEEIEKKGVNSAETDKLLLKKIEELTLYIIQQNKRIDELETRLSK